MYKDEDGFYHLTPKTYTATLRFKKDHDRKIIYFRHGHIAICGYKLGDNREFEKSLSTFDEIYWKYKPIGFYYIKELKELRINRGYDIKRLREYFPNYEMKVDNDAYPYKENKIVLKAKPKDDFQRIALTFMAGEGQYKANKNYTQIMISAATGSGKTYMGTAITCYHQSRCIVFVPIAKLLPQWKESFLNFTDLKEDEILLVQGSDTCKKILKGKYDKVKVFIFMVDTIASFVNRYGPLKTIELLRATHAYLKIVDEVHLDIKAISMLEAVSNFRMNYYLSASPGRTASKENWIFKTLFFNVPQFGANFKKDNEKHLNVIIKYYSFVPDQQQLKKMINPRKKWLNVKAYEDQLFNAPDTQRENFEQSLLHMLRWAKEQLGEENKILIFCGTIAGTEYLYSQAVKVFDQDLVSRYYGSMPSKEEKEQALQAKVICATVTSLGTGTDIKGLQFCFNTCTYSSKIEAIQVSGRLRKLPDKPVAYVEFVNIGWYKTVKQYEKRKATLMAQTKKNKLIIVE